MDYYKKWILIIAGIIIILIVAIFTLYQYGTRQQAPKIEEPNSTTEGNTTIHVKQEIQQLNSRNLYYTIENIIEKYQQYIAQNNQAAIKAVNLNQDDLLKITNSKIKQIYYKEAIYYGNYYISAIDEPNTPTYFALYLDNTNHTYLVEKLKESTFQKILQGTITKTRNEKISTNAYNQYQFVEITDETMVRTYIKNFIQTAKSNPDAAYNMLDSDYQQKKFGNVENFKNYLNNNLEKIENGTLTHYGADKEEGYTKYYYRDNNNYYFTIKEKSIMNYTILLDEYTIQDAEYIAIYDEFSEEEKVNNNILIFLKMLNEKEYQTAYQLLDETFRNNNFKTVAEFQKYVEQNFWNHNMGKITEIKKQGDLYLCTYQIKSGVGLSAEEVSKTFVMQLKEQAKFVMSFGI